MAYFCHQFFFGRRPKQRLVANVFQNNAYLQDFSKAAISTRLVPARGHTHKCTGRAPSLLASPEPPWSPGPPQHTDPQGRAGERGLCIAPRRRDRHALGLPTARKRGFKRKLPPFHSFFSPKPWRTIKPSPFFLYRAQQLPLNVLFETSWLQTLFISCPKAI